MVILSSLIYKKNEILLILVCSNNKIQLPQLHQLHQEHHDRHEHQQTNALSYYCETNMGQENSHCLTIEVREGYMRGEPHQQYGVCRDRWHEIFRRSRFSVIGWGEPGGN